MIDGGLRKLFRDRITSAMWVSVETGMTAQGVPDANYCFPGGVEGWVEYKQTKAHAVTFRPAQVGWLLRRERFGGRAFVAVRQTWAGEDNLWLLVGTAARELADGATLRSLPASFVRGFWAGGPGKWRLDLVEAELRAG